MNIGDFADHWGFANRPDGLEKLPRMAGIDSIVCL